MGNHRVWDNNSGANLDLSRTMLAVAAQYGFFVGGAGKFLNGWGETNNGGWGVAQRIPGHDFQRYQFGAPNYFGFTICDETATLTPHGSLDTRAAYTDTSTTDYAVDVEWDSFKAFAAAAATKGRPWIFYWSSKGPHQDAGGNPIPPARHASDSVTLTEEATFGVDPDTLGIPGWCKQVGESPWNAGAIAAIRATHTESLRTMRAVDETQHLIFTELVTRGWDQNTLVVLKTDNAHASGELRLNDKGTPHRSSSEMLLQVRVPGQAGGTCNAAVSDIDIAPFVYELTGMRPWWRVDGMSFHRLITNFNAAFREAAVIQCFKDSPAHDAVRFADGRVHYKIKDESNKGAGQQGGWSDAIESTNVNHADGPGTLATLMAFGPKGRP
jgi:arylsulfatase A-like enzyme